MRTISAVVREIYDGDGKSRWRERVDLLAIAFIEDACAAAGPIVWGHASAIRVGTSICGARM